jgi:hypothetical protein
MKHLRTFESHSTNEEDKISQECEVIFFDLIHDHGSSVDVSFPGKKSISGDPADIIMINFNAKTNGSFNPLKYIDSFYHLDSFLQSKGYKYYSNGGYYDTFEKRIKSFEEGGDLLLLTISYIKE